MLSFPPIVQVFVDILKITSVVETFLQFPATISEYLMIQFPIYTSCCR